MTHKPGYIHPPTLESGKIYLRKNGSPDPPALLPVQFIDYCACPAIVIITDGCRRVRCPRADLFLPEET